MFLHRLFFRFRVYALPGEGLLVENLLGKIRRRVVRQVVLLLQL